MDNIYIFETRELDYLNSYIKKAKIIGYKPIVFSNKGLDNGKRFNKFKELYQHLSVGTVEFEINCFARYFALADILTDDKSFILSDSDIYITNRKLELDSQLLNNTFVGSEGFFKGGSEWQISPHFSIWNKSLINNFVDYIISIYKQNREDDFLVSYYDKQKKRLGRTSISDMTLLYMWIKENKIPFINSNSSNNDWGIDHNISMLKNESDVYLSSQNRKKIELTNGGGVNFILKSGVRQNMSCVHFQGGYKQILNEFYLGNLKKFHLFSAYINLGRKIHKFTR